MLYFWLVGWFFPIYKESGSHFPYINAIWTLELKLFQLSENTSFSLCFVLRNLLTFTICLHIWGIFQIPQVCFSSFGKLGIEPSFHQRKTFHRALPYDPPPPGQPEALGKISVGNKWKEKQNQNLRLIEMETAKKKAQCQQSAKIFFHDNGNKRVMWVGCSHRKKNAAEPQQKTRKHTKWKFRPAVEITATEMVPFFPRIGAPKGGDWHLPPLAIHIAGGRGKTQTSTNER